MAKPRLKIRSDSKATLLFRSPKLSTFQYLPFLISQTTTPLKPKMTTLQPPISHHIQGVRVLSTLGSISSKFDCQCDWRTVSVGGGKLSQCPEDRELGFRSGGCRRLLRRWVQSHQMILELQQSSRTSSVMDSPCALSKSSPPTGQSFHSIKRMCWISSLNICPGPASNPCYSITTPFLCATTCLFSRW